MSPFAMNLAILEASAEEVSERDNSFGIVACGLWGYVDSILTYMPHLNNKPRLEKEILHNRSHQMDLFSSV